MGYFISEKCSGTYIYGILDNSVIIDYLLAPYVAKFTEKAFDYNAFKEEQYNKLADHMHEHVNIDFVYQMMQIDQ